MSSSLRNIAAEIAALEEEIVGLGGELPPGSDLERRWDEAQGALMSKVDSYAEYILSLEARSQALKDAIKKVAARANAMQSLADRLKRNADFVMGRDLFIEGEVYTLKRKLNPAAVVILDEDEVRASCPEAVSEVVTYKVDKSKLKAAIIEGHGVRGAVVTQGHRIEVC